MISTCPECSSPAGRYGCKTCGWRPAETTRAEAEGLSRCLCGSELLPGGQCAAGSTGRGGVAWPRLTWTPGARGGRAYAEVACPEVCPLCRGRLLWSGGCPSCHGCTTARREDWTFPGWRYDRAGDHWIRTSPPGPAATRDQARAANEIVQGILQHRVNAETAHQALAAIFGGWPEDYREGGIVERGQAALKLLV